jgi:putative peptidoglycan lipid II flippase
MSIGTVMSRATGLLRLGAIAAAFGVVETRVADAYNFANTAPNIIYELVLGGVLTSVFVPVFVELLDKEGRERAWEVASAIINVSLLVLMGITALGILIAPWLARFYTPTGAEAGQAQYEVLTFWLRLFIPQIIFYGLAALTGGLLNAHKRFAAPMYTPILNNLAVIAVFVAFHQAYPAIGGIDEVTTKQLWIVGLGTTAGVALMAIAQIPFLRGLGRYRLTFSVAHPAVRKLARLSIFVIGYVVANQIGYLIVQYLAKSQQGGYSAYITAFTFFLLPYSLFAVSIFTALLPGMSQHATNERWDDFRDRLSVGIRTTSLLIVPAAVGYFVLGEPIVRFLLERGIMTAESTRLVAGVLQLFTLGLLPFAVFQLFLRAFYAIQDTRTPFLINCGAVALNTAVNIPMFQWFGVRGLAAGHAIAYIFGVTLQARALSRRIGGLDLGRIWDSMSKILIAAGAMGIVVWGASVIAERGLRPAGVVEELIALGIPIGLGLAIYLGLAHRLGIQELEYARGVVGRRLRRR